MNERTTSPETTEALTLIRALTETYIGHPESLSISIRDFGDQVYFVMQGHTDDYRKLVGVNGAHVAALEFLVKQMGRARQVVHTFRLLEPEAGQRREEYPHKVADAYDTEPLAELLREIVLAVGIDEVRVATNFLNERTTERPLHFSFAIFTRTEDDYESLTISPPKARNNLTVVDALTVLFRAAQHKAGCRFSVSAINPASDEHRPAT